MGDIIFVGTSERSHCDVSSASRRRLHNEFLHYPVLQNTKGKQPIKQMAAIQERGVLVVLTGGKLQVHSVSALLASGGGSGTDIVPDIGSVRGATDVTGFHIKKDVGRYYLAAIHSKKKVTVYQLSDTVTSGEGMFPEVRSGLALPEVALTVAWSGASLLLGFKKEFVLMNTTTGQTTGLFPIDTNSPMAANMDPLHELVVGSETTGIRVSFEGTPCSNTGMAWGSQPSAVAFFHPYILSIHDGNQLEVRNPFVKGQQSQLCQALGLKYGDRISTRGYVDLDLPKPSNKARFDPSVLRRDVFVVTTGNSSVFILDFVPLEQQVLALAHNRLFEAALDLCQTCPNEVPQALLNEIRVMFAMHNFQQKHYQEAFQKFRESDVDPRFVIALFPGYMPSYVTWKAQKAKPIDAGDLNESTIREAVQGLVDYLQPRRRPPTAEEMAVLITLEPPTEENLMVQACIDTALMRSYVPS